uniref:Uncharacterized protein n=1 Tax=Homalodisca liturata TaxID=320908 RepID=A0A1B6HYQ5_9HEMI
MSNFYYIDCLLYTQNNQKEVNAVAFKQHVMSSVKTLFGEVGFSRNVDLLTYNPSKQQGILRCTSDHYVKLRGALTLYQSGDCSFRVINSSPVLLSLVSNSRTYTHS